MFNIYYYHGYLSILAVLSIKIMGVTPPPAPGNKSRVQIPPPYESQLAPLCKTLLTLLRRLNITPPPGGGGGNPLGMCRPIG